MDSVDPARWFEGARHMFGVLWCCVNLHPPWIYVDSRWMRACVLMRGRCAAGGRAPPRCGVDYGVVGIMLWEEVTDEPLKVDALNPLGLFGG